MSREEQKADSTDSQQHILDKSAHRKQADDAIAKKNTAFQQGNFDEAVDHYKIATRVAPTYGRAYVLLAKVQAMTNFEAAWTTLHAAIEKIKSASDHSADNTREIDLADLNMEQGFIAFILKDSSVSSLTTALKLNRKFKRPIEILKITTYLGLFHYYQHNQYNDNKAVGYVMQMQNLIADGEVEENAYTEFLLGEFELRKVDNFYREGKLSNASIAYEKALEHFEKAKKYNATTKDVFIDVLAEKNRLSVLCHALDLEQFTKQKKIPDLINDYSALINFCNNNHNGKLIARNIKEGPISLLCSLYLERGKCHYMQRNWQEALNDFNEFENLVKVMPNYKKEEFVKLIFRKRAECYFHLHNNNDYYKKAYDDLQIYFDSLEHRTSPCAYLLRIDNLETFKAHSELYDGNARGYDAFRRINLKAMIEICDATTISAIGRHYYDWCYELFRWALTVRGFQRRVTYLRPVVTKLNLVLTISLNQVTPIQEGFVKMIDRRLQEIHRKLMNQRNKKNLMDLSDLSDQRELRELEKSFSELRKLRARREVRKLMAHRDVMAMAHHAGVARDDVISDYKAFIRKVYGLLIQVGEEHHRLCKNYETLIDRELQAKNISEEVHKNLMACRNEALTNLSSSEELYTRVFNGTKDSKDTADCILAAVAKSDLILLHFARIGDEPKEQSLVSIVHHLIQLHSFCLRLTGLDDVIGNHPDFEVLQKNLEDFEVLQKNLEKIGGLFFHQATLSFRTLKFQLFHCSFLALDAAHKLDPKKNNISHKATRMITWVCSVVWFSDPSEFFPEEFRNIGITNFAESGVQYCDALILNLAQDKDQQMKVFLTRAELNFRLKKYPQAIADMHVVIHYVNEPGVKFYIRPYFFVFLAESCLQLKKLPEAHQYADRFLDMMNTEEDEHFQKEYKEKATALNKPIEQLSPQELDQAKNTAREKMIGKDIGINVTLYIYFKAEAFRIKAETAVATSMPEDARKYFDFAISSYRELFKFFDDQGKPMARPDSNRRENNIIDFEYVSSGLCTCYLGICSIQLSTSLLTKARAELFRIKYLVEHFHSCNPDIKERMAQFQLKIKQFSEEKQWDPASQLENLATPNSENNTNAFFSDPKSKLNLSSQGDDVVTREFKR